MKKYLLVITVLFAIPSITFAAWWNPLSWHIFSSLSQTSPQVQVTSTTPSSSKVVTRVATSTATVKPAIKKVAQKVSQPAVTPSTQSQTQQPTQPIGTLCNGTYWNTCPAGQNFICPQSGNAYCQLPQQPVAVVQTPQQNQGVTSQPISVPVTRVQNTINHVIQNQQPVQHVIQNNTQTNVAVTPANTASSPVIKVGKATVASNASTPSGQITVTEGVAGRYSVQVFNISGQNKDLQLQSIVAHITTSGTGAVATAFLYRGSTLVMSSAVNNGVANFSNISPGSEIILQNTTNTYTFKLDVSGLSPTSPLSITSSVNGSDVRIIDSEYNTVVASGSAAGNAVSIEGQ